MSFLDLGASPKWSRAETPVMPKQRYKIMSAYMPKVGALGLDMMFRTATIQANLDFTSEADMVKKFRAGLALQPVVTALFANSPFLDGKPTGALSQRSAIWRDTDAARTGMLPFVFEEGMGFERYVDYALECRCISSSAAGFYHDVAGASFRDLLAGRLPQLPGERATISDWANHLSTIFPEVRLKTYMEMRGADGGPQSAYSGLAGIVRGLFTIPRRSTARWTSSPIGRRRNDRRCAPRFRSRRCRRGSSRGPCGRSRSTCWPWPRRAYGGGRCSDAGGADESEYLAPLEAIAQSGRPLAVERLEAYNGRWKKSVEPAFEECVLL